MVNPGALRRDTPHRHRAGRVIGHHGIEMGTSKYANDVRQAYPAATNTTKITKWIVIPLAFAAIIDYIVTIADRMKPSGRLTAGCSGWRYVAAKFRNHLTFIIGWCILIPLFDLKF